MPLAAVYDDVGCVQILKPARFQIIKNTLELIYSQALFWCVAVMLTSCLCYRYNSCMHFHSVNVIHLALTVLALDRFGSFFCPLLPSLGVFKIVVLYYIKKHSTLRFCVPPVRAFKATHNFRLLLTSVSLASLVLVLLPLGYTIVKYDSVYLLSRFPHC